jgi:hypothetical protein
VRPATRAHWQYLGVGRARANFKSHRCKGNVRIATKKWVLSRGLPTGS